MPHLILEISSNIIETNDKIHNTLQECQNLLVNRLPTKLQNCKSRAIFHELYLFGDGHPENALVHLNVKVLKGRKPELLAEISKELQQILKLGFIKSYERLKLAISVEISELNDSYAPFI